MRNSAWVLGCLLAACGGGSGGGDDGAKIVIERFDDVSVPSQLAVRDGDGAWQVIASNATDFTVKSDRFLLAAGCEYLYEGFTFTYATMVGRTVDEAPRIELPCASYDDTGVPRHLVSVQMQEPGSVRIGDSETMQSSGPWTASMMVGEGTHTLTAFDTQRLAIRRDVAVTGETTLPPISLATDGQPFAAKPFTVAGAPAQDMSTFSLLYVDTDLAWYSFASGTTANVPDPAQLTADDRRVVYLLDGSNGRSVIIAPYVESAPTSFQLLPPLSGVARSGRNVTWDVVPSGDEYIVQLDTPDGMMIETIAVSSAWLGDATELAVDFSSIPNWDPALVIASGELSFEVQAHPDERTTLSTRVDLP